MRSLGAFTVTITSRISLKQLLILAAILAAYVFQVERARPELFFGQFHDDSIYFTTAKALAQGHGYTLISFPGNPPETKYPILYPWLLSLIWKLNPAFPDNLNLAVHVTELFGCWSLLAAFFLLRRLSGLGDGPALCLTAIWALQPVMARAGGLVMSDVPFAAVMLTVLTLCVSSNTPQSPWRYSLIGVLAGLSVGLRTIGIALVLGITCASLLKRSYRAASVTLLTAAATIGFVMIPVWTQRSTALSARLSGEAGWQQVAAYYTSYTQFQWHMGIPSIGALGHLICLNLAFLIASPGPIVIGTYEKAGFYLALLVSLPMWVGLIRQSRNSAWKPLIFTVLFYSAILLVWPYPSPERFLLPVFPALLAGLWLECKRIGAKVVMQLRSPRPIAQRALAGALLCLFVVLLSLAAWNAMVRDPRARQSGAAVQAKALEQRRQAYQWIRQNTRPEERVAAWQDATLYLYTGRQSLRNVAPLPQGYYAGDLAAEDRDLNHLCDAPRHAGVRYWMTATDDFQLQPHRERFLRRMKEISDVLPVVFQSDDGSVQVYDASCLTDNESEDCQAVRSVLFPK